MASNAKTLAVTRCCALGALFAVMLGSSFARQALAGENWTRFRGPNGAGVAVEEFPAKWTLKDCLWRVALPGKGHGSPVGWGELLFVASGDADSGVFTLAAIDAARGEIKWTRAFEGSTRSIHAANSYASGTPTVDDKRVYVTWTVNGTLHAAAVDHQGEVAWKRELGPADYKHGSGNSPILADELLVIANDHTGESFVVGLDAKSGEERWRRIRQGGTESYATPLIFQGEDGSEHIVVCSSAEGIAGLSPVDGSVLWQSPDVYLARCVSSPLIAAGMIFSGSGEGGNGKDLLAVRPASGASKEPEIAFALKKSLAQVPTPVAVGDRLFVWSDRGVVTCYDAADGHELWTKRIGGNYYGSPIAAGGKLHCVAANGEVVCIAAADKFELLGRSSLGEGSHATPAVHQGKMFLRTESSLICLPAVE
jgi:outer membrane protein assembly factor BamB